MSSYRYVIVCFYFYGWSIDAFEKPFSYVLILPTFIILLCTRSLVGSRCINIGNTIAIDIYRVDQIPCFSMGPLVMVKYRVKW